MSRFTYAQDSPKKVWRANLSSFFSLRIWNEIVIVCTDLQAGNNGKQQKGQKKEENESKQTHPLPYNITERGTTQQELLPERQYLLRELPRQLSLQQQLRQL